MIPLNNKKNHFGLPVRAVLLGADLNCYSVARAFYEETGNQSVAFGKYNLGVTQHTRFVDYHIFDGMEDDELLITALRDYADRVKDEDLTLILLGCTDEYAAFLIRNRERLEDKYIVPYTTPDLLDRLSDKAEFYEVCEKYGITYPKTVVISEPPASEALDPAVLGFDYPIIIKPSSSMTYWRYPFDGMEKVYLAENKREARDIIAKIYGSGYPARVILQDRIPGGDSKMHVLTVYSDKNGKVKAICPGHVLLEEHTPKGKGNHAAILTEAPPAITDKLTAMLEDLGYRGFSNFDIKYDERDGSWRVFEINLRQGRSNNYITSSGLNIAGLLCSDYICGETLERVYLEPGHLWHSVPYSVVKHYTDDNALVAEVENIRKTKGSESPYFSKPDLSLNPMRLIFVMETLRRQKIKYKNYCTKMR